MGEIADMMLEGLLCEGCGEVMDDMLEDENDPPGYPRRCAACAQADIEDDDSMAADFRAMKSRSKAKRAANRESAPEILKKAGIGFYSNNGGAHLICQYEMDTADFWPGTGRWSIRARGRGPTGRSATDTKGFGVFNLVKKLKGEK